MGTQNKLLGADPARILVVLLLTVFLGEGAIMLGFTLLPFRLPAWVEGVTDASLLTLFLFPMLYFFALRPIVVNNLALRENERRLRAAHDGIEANVAERTQELNSALARHAAHEERLAHLNEGTQLLLACRDIAEIGKVVAAQMWQLLPGIPGAFFTYRASRDAIERVASWNATHEDFPESIATGHCWALRRGRLHLGGNATGRLYCERGACNCAYCICVPLVAGSEVLGLISLRLSSDPETTTVAGLARSDWQLLLSAFRESVAVAVSNVRLRESLRGQALRDQLTGLFNRRFIDETLKIELARAARQDEPYSVAMIDVDHFKRFNDTYGHEAGDLVLSALGTHFSRHMRASDVACRYGGEEFLLLLPSTTGEVAVQVLEKLRHAVEALAVRIDATRQVSVTISCGIATYPVQGEDGESLIRNADSALYESKRAGRNRVTLSHGLKTEVASPDLNTQSQAVA